MGVKFETSWGVDPRIFKKTLQAKVSYFFFPRKSLRVTHSLDFRSGTKKKKTSCFFFRPKISNFQLVFFFLRKSLHCTHSLKIRGRKKKNSPGKKKKQLFHSLTRILSKSGEEQTFPGKKKYGTFATTMGRLVIKRTNNIGGCYCYIWKCGLKTFQFADLNLTNLFAKIEYFFKSFEKSVM